MQEDKYKRCSHNKGAVLNTDTKGLLILLQQILIHLTIGEIEQMN